MIQEHQRNPYDSRDRNTDYDDPRRGVDKRDLEPRAADPRSGDPRRAQQIYSSQPQQQPRRQQPGYARQDEPRFGEVRTRDRGEVRSDDDRDERYSHYDEGGYVREERHDREVERYRELNRENRERAEERRRERRERDRDRDASPAEIQAEIAETRADISHTIDALQAKLSPGNMLHSVVDRVTQDTGRSAREVVGALGRNPVPAALVGAGLLWLLIEDRTSIGQKRSRRAGRDEMWVEEDDFDAAGQYGVESRRKRKSGGLHIGERLQSAGGAISDVLHSARRAISGAGGRAGDMADDVRYRARAMRHNVRDRIGEVSYSARESARDAGGRVQHIAESTRHRAEEAYEHNPIAIGAAAIAAGMLAGLLIPATRREDELMGEARDDLLESAKDMTRGTLRAGMRVVKESAEAAEEEARRQNLDPEHLVEGARKVAGAAVETAREKTEQETDRIYSSSSTSSTSGRQGSQRQQQQGRSGSQGSSGSTANRPGQQRGGAGGSST